MHELSCPSCNATTQYELGDYLLLCPYCSSSFRYEKQSGQKDIFGDHFIVPNVADSRRVKDLIIEWLKRLHHNPNVVEQEYMVVEITGYSVPHWVISLQGHTYWKGMNKKQNRNRWEQSAGSAYLMETNQFHRSYRWCVSARTNIFETWGLQFLHEPKEQLIPEWDGFPLDSTFSRGRLETRDNEKNINDAKEYFEFKFSNGLPILGIQISRDEALRRAKDHVNRYHFRLAQLYVDKLVDFQTELEIAGVQLIHLPFWHARYVYKPRTVLRHIYKSTEKNVILDGYGLGILKGELPIIYKDKLWVNALVCGIGTLFMLLLGSFWHSAFFLLALFGFFMTLATGYMASVRFKPSEDPMQSTETGATAPGKAQAGKV